MNSMKTRNYLSFVPLLSLCTLLWGTASCSSDENDSVTGQGEGRLRIALKADGQTLDASVRSATSDYTPEVGDFALTILRNGEVVNSWEKFSQYPDEATFRVGKYTLEASYGKLETEGFEKPYFLGTSDFTVRDGETSQVEVTCQLENTMVSVLYTEAFRKYFSAYMAKVNSEGHAPVVYTAEESRAAYFMPGKITLNLEVTKRESGTTAQLLAATIDEALPRHHYRLTCDVNTGNQMLTVSFDDATEVKPVEINVSEDALLADPPFCVAQGFTPEEPVVLTEGRVIETPVQIYMDARAGLSQVLLKSTSPALVAQGWPAELDLAHPTAEQESLLTLFGVKRVGLGDRMEQIATVDLTQLLSFIPYDETKTENDRFELTVVDKNHRCNATPLQLQVKVISNGFAIEDPEPVSFGSNTFLFKMHLDGDPSQVTATYTAYGVDQPLTLEVVSSEGSVHTLRGTMLRSLTQESTLKVTLGSKTLSAPLKMQAPQFEVKALSAGDVWATRATLTVVGENEGTTAYLRDKNIIVEYAPAGTEDWVKPTQQRNGDQIIISGLPEDAEKENSYILRATATISGGEVAAKSTSEITTERALQLPNSGFEDWYYTRPSGVKYWEVYYACAEGETPVWNTLNQLTTSEGGTGTNMFNHKGCRYCANSGTIETTDCASGSKAALIRTVGWGGGNSAVGYDNSNNRTVGQLYLGSYDSESKAPLYGISFASRPKAISFSYKYAPVEGDRFVVEIGVYGDENGVETLLASQSYSGDAAESYQTLTIDINYTQATLKANKIYIAFKSGTLTTFKKWPDFANLSNGEFLGSELFIDDLKLCY